MINYQANLSTQQMQVLMAFAKYPDTRAEALHPANEIAASFPTLKKLWSEGYIEYVKPEQSKGLNTHGYRITPKGLMLLRIMRQDLIDNLASLEGIDEAEEKLKRIDAGKGPIWESATAKQKTKRKA